MVLGFASFVCTIGEEAALGGPILSGIGLSGSDRDERDTSTVGYFGIRDFGLFLRDSGIFVFFFLILGYGIFEIFFEGIRHL